MIPRRGAPQPSQARRAPTPITVHLLDSTLGRPVQTWTFTGRSPLTIGRADDSDVPISDPHVSRVHVKLEFQQDADYPQGAWVMISMGRHGTIMNDHVIAERALEHHDVFKLGSSGPTLRFELGSTASGVGQTVENLDPSMFDLFEIDEARKAEEVEEITSDKLFGELLEKTQTFKSHRPDKPGDAPR